MSFRKSGTDRNGVAFSEATKLAVWNKAKLVSGFDPHLYRKDACDAWMDWRLYGDTTARGYGWEIDHIS